MSLIRLRFFLILLPCALPAEVSWNGFGPAQTLAQTPGDIEDQQADAAREPGLEAEILAEIQEMLDRPQTPDGAEVVALLERVPARGVRLEDIADGLGQLAARLLEAADYVSAEALQRRVVAIRRQTYGSEHPQVAGALADLAATLFSKKDYHEAYEHLTEALRVFRNAESDVREDLASCLNDFGVLLKTVGHYDEAEECYQEALKIYEELHGNTAHPDVATTYSNLSILRFVLADWDEAELIARKALAIRKELYGDWHHEVGYALNNLAVALAKQGKDDEAERCQREALSILSVTQGTDHPAVVMLRVNLALFLHERGQYRAAEPLWVEAVEAAERARLRFDARDLGRNQFDADTYTFGRLVACLVRNGKPREAWRRFEDSLARCLRDALAEPRVRRLNATERQREDRLHARLRTLDAQLETLRRAQPLADEVRRELETLRTTHAQAAAELALLRAQLNEKYGVVSGETYSLEEIQKRLPPDAALIAWVDVRFWAVARGEHWGVVLRNAGAPIWVPLPGSGENGTWTIFDEELPDGVARLLARREVAAPLPAPLPTPPRAVEVCATMPAVEFAGRWLRTKVPLTPTQRDRLLSVSENLPKPHGEMWNGAVYGLFDCSVALGSLDDTRKVLDRLAAQRLEPLRPHLQGIRHLVVLPAGKMAKVPVEALNDDYEVSYAPSGTLYALLPRKRTPPDGDLGRPGRSPDATKLLPRNRTPPDGHPTLLALGDPPFNQDHMNQMAAEQQSETGPIATALAITRDGGVDDETLRGAARGERDQRQRFVRLPGTRAEVREIARLFATENRTLWVGPDASEPHLGELLRADRLREFHYLHFATHALANARRPTKSTILLSQVELPDPSFAANNAEPIYDGGLDMGEVLREWRGKLNAELVTISACQSALGRPADGEGHLGFAQAFLLAGAENLVLSLWSVNDDATKLLMIRFYQNMLGRYDQPRGRFAAGEPMPKVGALREAKCWLRELTWSEANAEKSKLQRGKVVSRSDPSLPNDDRPFEHPYYWAGFILIGSGN
ncbi:MAG: CHAT domain-containing protein [Phycisphaerae bacterium]|nr:CHAT domain-containing protein [Phycisphaerae bacterium]